MVENKGFHTPDQKYIPVPCGKCPNCLRRRTASWSYRLEVEALRWERQFFVTLTYDNDHIPLTDNTFMTLDREHLTNFFKRLRKNVGKLRYYGCGEYGTRGKRPHYHIILFGNSNMTELDISKAWVSPETQKPYGDIYFGKVEPASIRYTVQYYDKGDWRKAHGRDDRAPEFSAMSQGLGRNFLTEAMIKHLLANPEKGFIYDMEGKKIAIPRYFKRRLYDYFGTDELVYNHPSLLIHRDELVEAKETHHAAIAEYMASIEEPESEDTEQLNQARQMAIINYKRSKRKTRN